MATLIVPAGSLRRDQLRRLHALWHRWTRSLELSREADRELRHYYVERFTGGRAGETLALTEADAALVIRWLARLVERRSRRVRQAAGTAGRHGFPEQARVAPDASAWRALWGAAARLGMGREKLEKFIHGHYGGIGLRSLEDLRTMAALNRVLWGLKAMLRRRSAKGESERTRRRAA
jgi:hypothetical protein